MLKLVQATKENAKLIHMLQLEAFMPLYEKYHDVFLCLHKILM